MCGITGVMSFGGSLNSSDFGIFSQLVYTGALRGTDGTGAFAVADTGANMWVKIGGPPNQLFATPEWKSFQKFIDKRAVFMAFGHNRYASVGKPSTENAHPFKHGNIVLIHNGTIDLFYHYKKESEKFQVDSEAICYLIDKYEIDKVFETITGAWSIVYWDNKDKTLNIFKNDKRPLFLAKNLQEKLIFIASEEKMLQWVVDRQMATNSVITPIPNDTLISFKCGEEIPTVRDLKFKSIKKDYFETLQNYLGQNFVSNKNTLVKQDMLDIQETKQKSYFSSNHVSTTKTSFSSSIPSKASLLNLKTGKMLLIDKKNRMKESWQCVKHLHNITIGLSLQLDIMDYDPVKDVKDGFQLVCLNDEYPDIHFMCNVVGRKLADDLIEAGRINAKVMTILKSNNNAAISQHRIFMTDPSPEFSLVEPDLIPDHILLTGE